MKEILSRIKSRNNKDVIEKALEEISKNTKGYINCCIIFDIEKSRLKLINNVDVFFFEKFIEQKSNNESIKKITKTQQMWAIMGIIILLLLGGVFLIGAHAMAGTATSLVTVCLVKVIPIIIGMIIFGLFITFFTIFYGKFVNKLKYIDFNSILLDDK